MLSKRLQNIKILLVYTLLLISGSVYAQVEKNDTAYYDTTEYIPAIYKGSLDYNLMIAAAKGYEQEITRLVEKGADIFAETNQGATPLIFAVSDNQTKVAEMLIDYGSDVNKVTSQDVTPLLISVRNQNPEIAEALIRAGADIDASDKYGATPLHYASVYGYRDIADILLYYEASPDKKTKEGSTPLLASIWAGNADIADLLIQNGANMEARDNEGYTPFLMAAQNGDTLLMQLLFEKGVDIYATNALHHNALTLAIIADQSDAVKYLLKIGNKWANQSNPSLNPYTVATKYRRKSIIQILEDAKIPGKIGHEIDQVDIMVSTRFSLRDFYAGTSFSFKEPYLNGGIIFGFDTKLWYTRVLLKQSEGVLYQYFNKGSIVYAGLFKDFDLTSNAFKGNYVLSTSLAGGYSFGNELKGTLSAPSNKFLVIPGISCKWIKNNLSISLGADYMNSDFYHIGPVWLRFGAAYNLYFDKVRTKPKILNWY